MKCFNLEFRTKLWDTIADIEKNSLAEVVVIVKPRSGSYPDIPLWWGVATLFITFSFFIFAPVVFDFNNPFVYGIIILSFFVGYLLAYIMKPLQRLFLKKARTKKRVEIYCRATFQKAGIRHTMEKIGVLVYVSLFEREICIMPDRGAETMVPETEWKKLREGFERIFNTTNPADALLIELQQLKPVFNQYIPPIENDINELPDELDINL